MCKIRFYDIYTHRFIRHTIAHQYQCRWDQDRPSIDHLFKPSLTNIELQPENYVNRRFPVCCRQMLNTRRCRCANDHLCQTVGCHVAITVCNLIACWHLTCYFRPLGYQVRRETSGRKGKPQQWHTSECTHARAQHVRTDLINKKEKTFMDHQRLYGYRQ